jgi:hypothetical protein
VGVRLRGPLIGSNRRDLAPGAYDDAGRGRQVSHDGGVLHCAVGDLIETIRDQLPNVERFVALEGALEGWLDYETEIAAASEGI